MTSQQKTGAAGEAAAAAYLQQQGLAIVARNFRVRGGELDLICKEKNVTVFIEVRLRSHANFGGAAASITASKRRRIILAAQHWLTQYHLHDAPCRFDCVLIDSGQLEWIRDAFTAD
ncbi:MAG: YraN family protein [Rugosibacter sp.]|jgi:putative endonuclease